MKTEINLFHGDMRLLTEEGYRTFNDLSFFQSIKILTPCGKLEPCTIKSFGLFTVHEIGIMWKPQNIICTKKTKFKLINDLICTAEYSFCKLVKSYNYNFCYEILSINTRHNIECFGIIDKHHDMVVEDLIITGEIDD